MSRAASQPDYLTTVAIPADTVAELGFSVEVSVNAAGEVGLPASHAPYLFSVHLPAGDDAGRLNVGAFDAARREVSIETVQRAIDSACEAGASRGVVHSMGIVSFEGGGGRRLGPDGGGATADRGPRPDAGLRPGAGERRVLLAARASTHSGGAGGSQPVSVPTGARPAGVAAAVGGD